MNIFVTLVEQPITNVLVAIYNGLQYLDMPAAFGFSIIVLTVLIRFLIYPLMSSQLKHSKKMQDLAPETARIKELHKGDMKKQQEATMALYKEHGFNPAAGCLPVLVQLPILIGLYGALQKAVSVKSVDEINKLVYADYLKLKEIWDTNFFGLPLGKNPGELLPTVGPAILLVVVLTAALQFIQSKMITTPSGKKGTDVAVVKTPGKVDFASSMQTQMLYMVPLFIGFLSYGFPLGLSLYWNTFSLFGIIHQYRISGLGGLTDFFPKTSNK